MNTRIFALPTLTALLLIFYFGAGCGSRPTQTNVERVRSEVAKILKKDLTQIEVTKPLPALGADDLDIVEIVMAVEEAFKVEIPDSAIAGKGGEVSKSLTVQTLAEIVAWQQKAR